MYDAEDLKERIRSLRSARSQIDTERKQLEDELIFYERKFASLKKELNIIECTDDLRGTADDFVSEELNSELQKKFKLLNDKLDMKILNQEIRVALPYLEKVANSHESNAKGKQKISNKYEKDQKAFPSVILQPSSEVEEQVGLILEDHFKVKANISKDFSEKKKEKIAKCSDIASLRRQLATLSDEREMLLLKSIKLKVFLQEERYNMASMAEESNKLR